MHTTHEAALRSAPLIHKWFARRLTPSVVNAWERAQHLLEGDEVVADPFCGAGTLPLLAALQGRSVLAADVNPVAAAITAATLNPPDPEQFRLLVDNMTSSLKAGLSCLYTTFRPDGREASPITYFYVRRVRCSCGAEYQLHHTPMLARRRSRNEAWMHCIECGHVFKTQAGGGECNKCGHQPERSEFFSSGKLACRCGRVSRLRELAAAEQEPFLEMIAIESLAPDGTRDYHRPSPHDLEVERIARRRAERTELWKDLHATLIPVEGRRDARPVSHGYRSYGSLFFPRQILGLSLLSASVPWDSLSQELKVAAGLLISDTANNNSRLCSYAADWLKQSPSFAIHAYRPPTRPVEGNFLGASLGRGSFRNVAKKASRAYSLVAPILSMGTSRKVICEAAEAIDQTLLNQPFVVYTDPPYYDYLDYADLSDFFFQVLRHCTVGILEAPSVTVHSRQDISLMATQPTPGVSFGEALGRSLRPFASNPNCRLIVLHFHHSTREGWRQLTSALKGAHLRVLHVGFERSDLENGFHSAPGNAKLDALFYLVPRAVAPPKWGERGLVQELLALRRLEETSVQRKANSQVVAGALAVWKANKMDDPGVYPRTYDRYCFWFGQQTRERSG